MKNNKREFKKNIKKFWNFLWNDDSLLSWFLFLIIIFVFIKFIFFPTLSLIFGTSLPIVIVESCSMHHGEEFEVWWNENEELYKEFGITKNNFENFSLKNGFTKGDIFFVRGVDKENVEIGDIIIFTNSQYNKPIIHRVVDLNPLQTKGDNNQGQIPFEKNIDGDRIIGKSTQVRIPYIGWLKLIFFEPFRTESERGFCR